MGCISHLIFSSGGKKPDHFLVYVTKHERKNLLTLPLNFTFATNVSSNGLIDINLDVVTNLPLKKVCCALDFLHDEALDSRIHLPLQVTLSFVTSAKFQSARVAS